MEPMQCNVCATTLGDPIYSSETDYSLSSLCQVLETKASVYQCRCCGHIQSTELKNVTTFYDINYPILVSSEEEDQIYETIDGQPVFRTQHQVRTLVRKVKLDNQTLLLDFGCAKSSTIKALVTSGINIVPHAFDVSDRYVEFWRSFIRPENWAVYEPRPEWKHRFDLVTSFFSLEHIVEPSQAVQTISSLLKDGGALYGIVPNVFSNIADLIVVDHVNHFTASSLSHLLLSNGFGVEWIDSESHRGALVFMARCRGSTFPQKTETIPSTETVVQENTAALKIAEFWKSAGNRAREFEEACAGEPFAIYGAGFYGAFLASNLRHPERATCFVDQNPFLQNKQLMSRPIFSPDALPGHVHNLIVGLNPAHSKSIISNIAAFRARNLRYFFL